LRRIPWRSFGLAEDREFSWRVRINGDRIDFDRDAIVYATMPSEGGRASMTQRQRWEHGRRELKRKMLSPLLKSPHLAPLEKAISAIELTMPTMVCLLGIFLILSLAASVRLPGILARHHYVLGSVIGGSYSIAITGVVMLSLSPFLLAFLPWRISRSLLHVPIYAGWKVIVALKARPDAWIRTAREITRIEVSPLDATHPAWAFWQEPPSSRAPNVAN
jgi:hypothetical protein